MLPATALVVRGGGRRSAKTLVKSASLAHRRGFGYSLSTCAAAHQEGESDGELLARIVGGSPQLVQVSIRVTTVGALAEAGLTITQTGLNPYHHSVDLGTVGLEQAAERFEDCFGEERAKP